MIVRTTNRENCRLRGIKGFIGSPGSTNKVLVRPINIKKTG